MFFVQYVVYTDVLLLDNSLDFSPRGSYISSIRSVSNIINFYPVRVKSMMFLQI